MSKLLAMTEGGELTYCTAPPELRGKGRCNHIAHQIPEESSEEFMNRIEELQIYLKNKIKPNFIPLDGADIELKPYRMSDEEKAELIKIENKMQLDQNIDGGYIELSEPLWNDMDKNYFSQISNIDKRDLEAILKEEIFIVTSSEDPNLPTGKLLTSKNLEALKKRGENFEAKTGLSGLNSFSKENYNFEATKDIYVLPYYMRMGNGEGIESDLTVGYKYLLRQTNSNSRNRQMAYEALIDNSSLDKNSARYSKGYKNKSLSDQFAGKGGVFRACLSGSSVPYGARTVITPTTEIEYGELRIPASTAVDIYKPTLIKQLVSEGKTPEEIDSYFAKFRVEQSTIKQSDRDDLGRRIYSKRVIMNRQPSLHTASFQSFTPRISTSATTQIHPAYCQNYGADFDGDTVSLFALNDDSIIEVADKTIGAKNKINTQMPRNLEKSAILPSKDSLWGLLNILDKRTN